MDGPGGSHDVQLLTRGHQSVGAYAAPPAPMLASGQGLGQVTQASINRNEPSMYSTAGKSDVFGHIMSISLSVS